MQRGKKKVVKGEVYYYAKCKRKMQCFRVGKKLSWFSDYKKSIYQFYNVDMYTTKYQHPNPTILYVYTTKGRVVSEK